jgi:hypothetical protein
MPIRLEFKNYRLNRARPENRTGDNRNNIMEKMHIEPGPVADPEVRGAPRKAWHAPAVRWLDVRETRNGFGGASDGGPTGTSVS